MRDRNEALVTGAADGERRAAFVIPHPYVDALACFREPIRLLAEEGWEVDLYTAFSPFHPAPFFGRENVRLIPVVISRSGAVDLVRRLVCHRPKYRWHRDGAAMGLALRRDGVASIRYSHGVHF